jgi:hypothetical protein
LKVKKVLLILFVGFLVFWLIQNPTSLADSSQSLFSQAWELLVDFFEALLDFLGAL